MKQYEAMFLFDPTFGSSSENCEGEIQRLLQRADAEIVFNRLWDERRLAYRVKGRKRGVYWLTYFKAEPGRIASLERDIQISENLLRAQILTADGITQEMMERAAETSKSEDTSSARGGDEPRRGPGGRSDGHRERGGGSSRGRDRDDGGEKKFSYDAGSDSN